MGSSPHVGHINESAFMQVVLLVSYNKGMHKLGKLSVKIIGEPIKPYFVFTTCTEGLTGFFIPSPK